jgi:hypothetical protein
MRMDDKFGVTKNNYTPSLQGMCFPPNQATPPFPLTSPPLGDLSEWLFPMNTKEHNPQPFLPYVP